MCQNHICLLFVFWVGLMLGITHPTQAQKWAPDSVKALLTDVVRELDAKHPGFYRYHTRAEFGRYIDSVKNTVTDSLTEMEIYRVFKPVFGKIGCLHTGLSLPKAYADSLDRLPNLFPFQLYVTENRAFVVQNHSAEPAILPGDEITDINGRSMAEILRILLPAIPSDGYNLSMKYRALYHSFPLWYRSMVEITGTFKIGVRQHEKPVTYTLAGKKYTDMAEGGFLEETVYPQPLEFSIKDQIGLLTIHTFSQSDFRAAGQRFKPLVDDAFRAIRVQSVPNLIIDLRDNTGGSDANAAYLCRYFFDKPYRYWDRIEVTESVAREIKGVYRFFYRRPIQKDSLWLWQKAKTVRDFDFYETQRPVQHPYTGKVYILINGFCMSSCADLVAVLAYHKKAVFVGEETGGGFQGNNSGMMPTEPLPPTRLLMTVPLQKYHTAVDPVVNFGRGTPPDYPIKMTVEEIIRNEDKALSFTFALIKNGAPTF